MRFANKNYENDINYTVELNRLVSRLLGIWPYTETRSRSLENVKRYPIILLCYFFLFCEMIPAVLYILIIEKDTRIRIKLMAPVIFTAIAIVKYTNLLFYQNLVRQCLMRVEDDWRNVVDESARDTMIGKAKISRQLFILCSVFMYSTGVSFRTIMPLTKGKIITADNITIRHLPCPSHFVIFNARRSPAYEIVFVMQFFSGFIKYTITVAICGLAALLAMHICAQLEILMNRMKNLVNERDVSNVDEKLAIAVEHQIKIRDFLNLVQTTLQYMNLMEITGCTVVICLLGYYVITEWENRNPIAICSYGIALGSITFNIFIFCYIGERLCDKGEKLAITVCTLDWYNLPNAKARALILIMAISNSPMKLKAGNIIALSLRSFGDVVKTAATYFNLLRRMVD